MNALVRKSFLFFLLTFMLASCSRGRMACHNEQNKIMELNESISELAKLVKKQEIQLKAKDELIGAQITVLAMMEGGQEADKAFGSQLSRLALRYSEKQTEVKELKTKIENESYLDFKAVSLK